MESQIAENAEEDQDPEYESGMDVTLYLIKDDFPAIVVGDMSRIIDNTLDGVKMFFDFRAYFMIEFVSKKKMEAAKEAGFSYVHNGQIITKKYASFGRLLNYVRDKLPANIGNGF